MSTLFVFDQWREQDKKKSVENMLEPYRLLLIRASLGGVIGRLRTSASGDLRQQLMKSLQFE